MGTLLVLDLVCSMYSVNDDDYKCVKFTCKENSESGKSQLGEDPWKKVLCRRGIGREDRSDVSMWE